MEPRGELPEFYFNASAKLTEEEAQSVMAREKKPIVDFGVEKMSMSPEMAADLCSLVEDVALWMKKGLDVDVLKRLPSVNDVQVYSKENWSELKYRLSQTPDIFGLAVRSKSVLVSDQENKKEVYNTIIHEIIHLCAAQMIKVRDNWKENLVFRDGPIGVFRTGFTDFKSRKFYWLNEAVTELMHLDVLAHSDKPENRDLLLNMDSGDPDYPMLFDMIFSKIAQKTGFSHQNVRYKIYKSYLTGNFSNLVVFKDVFSLDALRNISDDALSYQSAENLFGIDMEEFTKKISDYKIGLPVKLDSGITIQRSRS